MDICTCKPNKRIQGFIRAYVLLSSLLYALVCVLAVFSDGIDIVMVFALIGLLAVIMVGVALWRMRAGHSFACALLWAYVSPIAELHKSIRNLSQ